MPHGPHDPAPRVRPTPKTPNAPTWSGRPGWLVYAVTTDATAAAARAAAVAAEHHAQLAPATWPVDTVADLGRLAVGPVYVGVRTRHGHAHGAPLATYYVLRRWVADEDAPAPDPTWPVPGPPPADGPDVPADTTTRPAAGALVEPAPPPPPTDERAVREPAPPWPFMAIGRRTERTGTTTLGADVITWRGRLATAAGARTITFTTQPRAIDAHAASFGPANVRTHDATRHREFVDVCVHHALDDAERAALAALAQAQDARPVVVRCAGERVRATLRGELPKRPVARPPDDNTDARLPPEGRGDA